MILPLDATAVAATVTLFVGNCIVWFAPAFTVGGTSGVAAFTVIDLSEVQVHPLTLSVTVIL